MLIKWQSSRISLNVLMLSSSQKNILTSHNNLFEQIVSLDSFRSYSYILFDQRERDEIFLTIKRCMYIAKYEANYPTIAVKRVFGMLLKTLVQMVIMGKFIWMTSKRNLNI